MFNRKIEITEENESILFINAVVENLRYGIISLDMMFNCDKDSQYCGYYDEHTFYFFHMQSVLAAQGNFTMFCLVTFLIEKLCHKNGLDGLEKRLV